MITVQDDNLISDDKHPGAKAGQRKTTEFRSIKVGNQRFLIGEVLKLILEGCLGISCIRNEEMITDRK